MDETAPFCALLGPNDDVGDRGLLDGLRAFYLELFTQRDATEAFNALRRAVRGLPYLFTTAQGLFGWASPSIFARKPPPKGSRSAQRLPRETADARGPNIPRYLEGGRKATIGVSFKGRLWSMSSSTIPDWVKWCHHVASKVLNPHLLTEGFLAHTLIPREIAQLPDSEILSILLPDEWLIDPEAFRIAAGLETHTPVTVGIALWNRVANDRVEMTLTAANVSARFELKWREEVFEVQQLDGIPISIETDDGPMSLASYFSEHVPILLLADGSEVRGGLLLARRAQLPTLFDRNEIRVLDWAQTPIRTESKWRHGVLREASVQGHLIADRMNAENAFLVDDDDSGAGFPR
jgi:hypothetical protein